MFLGADLPPEETKGVQEMFRNLGHYEIARWLTEEAPGPDFVTSDFQIFWSANRLTIGFFREQSRDKFEKILQDHQKNELVQKFNRLRHEKTLFSEKANDQNGPQKKWLKENDDDDGIVFDPDYEENANDEDEE